VRPPTQYSPLQPSQNNPKDTKSTRGPGWGLPPQPRTPHNLAGQSNASGGGGSGSDPVPESNMVSKEEDWNSDPEYWKDYYRNKKKREEELASSSITR
jgi:hypothetical protein